MAEDVANEKWFLIADGAMILDNHVPAKGCHPLKADIHEQGGTTASLLTMPFHLMLVSRNIGVPLFVPPFPKVSGPHPLEVHKFKATF